MTGRPGPLVVTLVDEATGAGATVVLDDGPLLRELTKVVANSAERSGSVFEGRFARFLLAARRARGLQTPPDNTSGLQGSCGVGGDVGLMPESGMRTVAEACYLLRCSESWFHVLRHRGSFPGSVKIGRRRLIPMSDINRVLLEGAPPPPGESSE